MEKRFIVTNHEYINTGGNTMVSIFAVYDSKENVSRWVIANDLGFSWQTADTVSNCDFQMDCDEIMDKVLLGTWDWDELIADPCYDQHLFTEDEFELFKYCQFEFYKKDCKYFNNKVRLATNELPTELFNKLTPEYIAWANLEGAGCWTDGYDVFMDDEYDSSVYENTNEAEQQDKVKPLNETEWQLTKIKCFKRRLDRIVDGATYNDTLDTLYDEKFMIVFRGHAVEIDFDAEVYHTISNALQHIIDEY